MSMAVAVAVASAVASTVTLRLDGRKSNAAIPDPLLLPKPSWFVRTESNVRRKRMRKPDPPCVICQGSGRVDCHYCYGRGRTNEVHLEMLPKGEWPKWCRTCGGSGLSYCSRCLGTGEYRYIMGFHFMKRDDDDHTPKINKCQIEGDGDSWSAADGLFHREYNNSGGGSMGMNI